MSEQDLSEIRLSIRIALFAVLTALTAVLTIIIEIPVPATQGYINLGDVGVLLAGLLLGPFGGLAGGLGSALADVALGYYLYAPITFVVKGIEGTIVGLIMWTFKLFDRFEVRVVLAVLLGSCIMVFGYYTAEVVLFGPAAALVEVPGNIFQVVFGSIVAVSAFLAINKGLPYFRQKTSMAGKLLENE
ncbi:MAG: ECF transporter S component [Promethearchaeota archaeon]